MSDFRYTPRTVGIIKLHARTMSPVTIATIMCCSVGTIELICRKHGIEMRELDHIEPAEPTRAERKKTGTSVEILIDSVTFTLVAKEARLRGAPTRELIARLVDEIAKEQLFGAVLDR